MSNFGDLPDVFADAQEFVEEPADETVGLYARLYPTGGSPVYLPIADPDNPPTIADAVQDAGVSAGGSTQYWVEGVQVNPMETRIAPNLTITAVGNVKGG